MVYYVIIIMGILLLVVYTYHRAEEDNEAVLCKCGHMRKRHINNFWECSGPYCKCKEFVKGE